MYGYASYAYGETPVYPRHRIGVEVFRGIGGGFEASLGGRFFSFLNDQSVFLGTGSLSYYTGKFIFTAKPFVSLNTSKTAVAGVFSTRYYLSENEEFLTGRVTGGFTTDERWIQTSQGISGQQTTLVQSQSIGFAIQKIVARKVMFLGRLDMTRQEVVFRPGSYVLDFAIGCGVRLLL